MCNSLILFVLSTGALTFINIVKVKWAAHGQAFFTSISIIALLVICVAGFVYIGTGTVCLPALNSHKIYPSMI